ERFRKLSSRMEALLVNSVLSVPANVLLPDDEAQRKYPQSQDRLLKLEASTAELQQAYQAEVCARQALLAELEEQRETQTQLEEVLTWVEELRLAWKQGGMGNIRDSFKRMMQTVTQLQSVMDEIKKKSKHAPQSVPDLVLLECCDRDLCLSLWAAAEKKPPLFSGHGWKQRDLCLSLIKCDPAPNDPSPTLRHDPLAFPPGPSRAHKSPERLLQEQ
ncbi:hypothetical protein P4O66_016055, partial [Electrophorus voltai]